MKTKTRTKTREEDQQDEYRYHPGNDILQIITANNMTKYYFSKLLDVSYTHIYLLTRKQKRANLGIQVATKLEIATGIPVSYWMEKQSKYNMLKYPERYKYVRNL